MWFDILKGGPHGMPKKYAVLVDEIMSDGVARSVEGVIDILYDNYRTRTRTFRNMPSRIGFMRYFRTNKNYEKTDDVVRNRAYGEKVSYKWVGLIKWNTKLN